ncbi:MAG: Rieske (2Fe-2S) protein [Pseudomarimonas sp.]
MGPDVTEASKTESAAQHLCALEAVADGGALEVSALVDGQPTSILLLRAGAEVRAFHNVCPHAGRALNWAPGRFLIESGLLICAAHGASFVIPNGHCVSGPCRGSNLQGLPLTIMEGQLWLAAE